MTDNNNNNNKLIDENIEKVNKNNNKLLGKVLLYLNQ
jgi:hypothetical protein